MKKTLMPAATAVLAVITLLATAAVLYFGWSWWGNAQAGSARDGALDAGRDIVTKIMTISPSTIDDDLASVEKVSTGDFSDQWKKGEDRVKQSVLNSGAHRTSEILNVAYVKGDASKATVILAVDTTTKFTTKIGDQAKTGDKKQDRKATAAAKKADKDKDGYPDPVKNHFRIKATLASVDGNWRIAKMVMH